MKRKKDAHPSNLFNNAVMKQSTSQKHLRIYLDEKLNFNAHIKKKVNEANLFLYRGIDLIKEL